MESFESIFDTEKTIEELRAHRRALHRIPEQDFDLPGTAAYIRSVLDPLDCEITAVHGTGLAAFFDFGKGGATAYRTDMDALPVTETSGVPFASEHEGKMHACGHDGHMAMMLVFARYLGALREEWKKAGAAECEDAAGRFPASNVLLLFQPGEETITGGKIFAGSGILEKYGVKRIFAFHLWPHLPAGQVASLPGPMLARSGKIFLTVTGETAHAADSAGKPDAILACAKAILRLEEMPVLAETRSILKIGKIEGGAIHNAVAADCRAVGSIRARTDEIYDALTAEARRAAEEVTAESGCDVALRIEDGSLAVVNDPDLFAETEALLGDGMRRCEPVMISEDYSFLQRKVPGVLFFLGTGTGIALHSSDFNFDESILLAGVRTYYRLLELA